MDEYIPRKTLLDWVHEFYPEDKVFASAIRNAPAADVAPVRHGRWVLGTVEPGYLTPGGNRPWICSECKQVISWSLGRPYENYCPNCGAKMYGDNVV